MKEPYDIVNGRAQAETEKAFCIDIIDDMGGTTHSNLWIPKSVIHEESHDTIEEAIRGETVEIYVARWWADENI